MRRLRVETFVDLTQAQREMLQHLGCEAMPFISWPHALLFAATCTGEQERELCLLDYVTSVGPMPTYGIA